MADRRKNLRHRTTPYWNRSNFYDREISKMNDNLETSAEEFNYWKQIRNLSKELEQLYVDFDNSVDRLSRQRIRDETEKIDGEVVKLARNVIELQEKVGYRPTIQFLGNNISPMEIVQDQINAITIWIGEISTKKKDLEKLQELTAERQELYNKLRRLRDNSFEKLQVSIQISSVNRDISALRDKYYQPLQ